MTLRTLLIPRPYLAELTVLIVSCPLARDRDSCPCNDQYAPCRACRDGEPCGCPLEIMIEYGPDVREGYRVFDAPNGCPFNAGEPWTDAERAELGARIAAVWANSGLAPLPEEDDQW
jgi:hypothetical protein